MRLFELLQRYAVQSEAEGGERQVRAELASWDAEELCRDLIAPGPGFCWEVTFCGHWHKAVAKWWERAGVRFEEMPGSEDMNTVILRTLGDEW